LMLPIGARASITYSFSSSAGSFSITNPTILTTSATLSFTPFTLEGGSFTYGAVLVSQLNDVCFLFATSNTGENCGNFGLIIPDHTQFATGSFHNAISPGTYSEFVGGPWDRTICTGGDGPPCVVATDWTLTISNTVTATPEPSSLLLLGTGALGLFEPISRKLLPRK